LAADCIASMCRAKVVSDAMQPYGDKWDTRVAEARLGAAPTEARKRAVREVVRGCST